VQEIVLYTV